MRKAEILTIGDEILIGQIINTNSVWIAQELNKRGVSVKRMTTVADRAADIREALEAAIAENDLILLTGGLGPTRDDITKSVLAEFFQSEWVVDTDTLAQLEAFYAARNRVLNDANRGQASVPANCRVLLNKWGTAPGMLFEHEGKWIVSLPGVPFEMKALLSAYIFPELESRYHLPAIEHRSFLTQGIPESELMYRIKSWEDALPPFLTLAYLPSVGEVKLRLTSVDAHEKARPEMDVQEAALRLILGDEIYGYEGDSLPAVIVKMLTEMQATISTAESCTGGFIAHQLTSVSGSSKVYLGSLITYDNRIKTQELGVSEELLMEYGAVSGPVVCQMASAIRQRMQTGYSIAVSGIAGPTGGTDEKPVGTVWIAWGTPQGVYAHKFLFGDNRERNMQLTAQTALNVLRKILSGNPPQHIQRTDYV